MSFRDEDERFGNVEAAIKAGMSMGEVREVIDGELAAVLVPAGARLEQIDLLAFEAKYADNPRRKTGTRALTTAASFIAYANAHKEVGATAIYAKKSNTSFEVVFNDHEPNHQPATGMPPEGSADPSEVLSVSFSEGIPGHGDFKASYACPQSIEWKRWMAKSQHEKDKKEGMQQAEFMQFLEDNLPDIIKPEGAILLTAARSFEAKKDVAFKSATRLEDGSITFNYDEKVNEVTQAGKIALPSEFTINIPVFEGGVKYQIDARLRYRVGGGGLVLWYELVQTHKILEHAFNTVREQIAQGVNGVPVYDV